MCRRVEATREVEVRVPHVCLHLCAFSMALNIEVMSSEVRPNLGFLVSAAVVLTALLWFPWMTLVSCEN